MQQMQTPQPPQLNQGAMMPHPGGHGMVPMATTTDPALKCFSDGCNYAGTGICRWNNIICRSKKRGGCGRRYCHLHKFEKLETIRSQRRHGLSYVKHISTCIECGEGYEADIMANNKCGCLSFCIGLLIFIALLGIPFGIFMANAEKANYHPD